MEPMERMTVGGFLGSMAAKSPAPGGGAAASVVGATAAALAGMVLAYSVNRKSLAEHRGMLEEALSRAADVRGEMLRLGDEDAAAYAALNEIQRLDPGDPRRVAEEAGALERATAVPARVMELAGEFLGLLETLVGKINPYLRSDLAIAAVLGRVEAAVRQAGEARGRIEAGCA